jgi:hypothetical protein
MAKVTGALFSMDASGKFGGAMVFSKWKGRQVVHQLVTPANPMSADQETARNMVRVTGSAQKAVNGSAEVQSGQTLTDKALLIAAAPAGFAWNGVLTTEMIGAGALKYDAASTAYSALAAGEKTAWDSAADARTPPFSAAAQKSAGGASTTAITSGEVYFRQQYAMYTLGIFTAAPSATPPTYA